MTNEWNGPRICIKNFRMKETCGFTQIADEMISGSRPSIGSFWVTHTHNDSWKRNPIESHKQRNHQTSARGGGGGGIEATKIQQGGRMDGGPSTGKMSSKNKAGDAFCCLVQCVAATVLHLTKVTQNKRPTDRHRRNKRPADRATLSCVSSFPPAGTDTHPYTLLVCASSTAQLLGPSSLFAASFFFFFGVAIDAIRVDQKTWRKGERFVFYCRPLPPPLNALDPLQHPLTIHPINQHEASFYVRPFEGVLLIFIKCAANQAGPCFWAWLMRQKSHGIKRVIDNHIPHPPSPDRSDSSIDTNPLQSQQLIDNWIKKVLRFQ